MGNNRHRPVIAQQSESQLVHQPFRNLEKIIPKAAPVVRSARAAKPVAPVPVAPVSPPPAPRDGEALFRHAMADVRPLHPRERERVASPVPASPARAVTDPDAEALAELCDLVGGAAPFDISDSDEYVEGAIVGLDPRLLRRLRKGEFAYQAHIDLHGLIAEEARRAVEEFLTRAHRAGNRCVLIVHGRGHNSKDQVPVLKRRLTTWLARGHWSRLILAFTSARACDGGAGALYVLLRRRRDLKHPMRVTNGAKR
jgi:DNA-nicking Smr family endonuclease